MLGTCLADDSGGQPGPCAESGASCSEIAECCPGLTCRDGTCQEFPPDSFVFDVTYQDDARVISEATIDNGLLSVGDPLVEYRFDATADEIAALEVGDVVLFSGLSLRRVTERTEQADEIVIATDDVTLNELIRDGTIG